MKQKQKNKQKKTEKEEKKKFVTLSPVYNKLNWDKITNTLHYMINNKNHVFVIKLPKMQGMCIGLQLGYNNCN